MLTNTVGLYGDVGGFNGGSRSAIERKMLAVEVGNDTAGVYTVRSSRPLSQEPPNSGPQNVLQRVEPKKDVGA